MKKALPLIILVVLAVVAVALKNCSRSNTDNDKPKTTQTEDNGSYTGRGLNRNPAHINYSKHARCRMDCRHIDESEVKYILKNGKINYSKSDLKGAECKKRYAVEGVTKDDQKVRIIFAPCNDEVTVVTVIDLGEEWQCDCE